jgi:hypothetical protein
MQIYTSLVLWYPYGRIKILGRRTLPINWKMLKNQVSVTSTLEFQNYFIGIG